MAIKTSGQLSLSDISASHRKCKHTFFDQINNLINWSLVEKELRIYYPKGKKSYDLHEDGTVSVSQSYQKGIDQEASWTKKGHNLYYGYKRHILVTSILD